MDSPPRESTDLCGGCRAPGRCRLGLTSWEVAVDGVVAHGSCPASWAGGPRIAHGGWTAAVFDDVVGRAVLASGEWSVTAHLAVDFVLPVPVEHDVLVRARVTASDGRRRTVEAVMELVGSGQVLGRATATMVVVDDRHYERHHARMGERAEEGGAKHAG